MKLYVYKTPDQDKGDPGVHCTFVDEDGRKSSTFFSSPPESISHVDKGYLKDRFTNVQTEKQAVFIKERFSNEIKRLKDSVSPDIEFLKELQTELNAQETDHQGAPRFWSIMDYKWRITENGHHDRVSLFHPDSGEAITLDEYVDEILNGDRNTEFDEEQIEELKENKEYFQELIEDWIIEHDDDEYHFLYEEKDYFIAWNSVFFTKQEAKDHLESNAHHYSDEAHTFAMTAWRAPKMERLMKVLYETNWDSIKEFQYDS